MVYITFVEQQTNMHRDFDTADSVPATTRQAVAHNRHHTASARSPGETMPPQPTAPTPERLLQMAWGFAAPLILDTALRYRVFDALEHAPLSAAEVASRTSTSIRGMTMLVNALVGLELLQKEGNRVRLTPESAAFLVSTQPAYHGEMFRHTAQQVLPNWLHLSEIVRTGRPRVVLNQETDGADFFMRFVAGLFPMSYRAAQVLGAHLGVPAATGPLSVLDIGAGSGVWGIAMARQSPHVTIRAVDWPEVLEVTRQLAARHGVAERLTTVSGDLLKADFGTGHQVATIGHILHSEGPARSRRLLRKTFEALAPGGTVAIGEFVPNEERTGPAGALIFAVNMLVHTESGDTFSFGEISEWLLEAGFQNPRQLEAPAPSPLILATRPVH
jgi:2-polyprenyl-3-methyl-5-hydroxy-6-metoxy-1,4-benzoquinol methylase